MLYNQDLDPSLYSATLPAPVVYDETEWIFSLAPTHFLIFINGDGTGTIAEPGETISSLEPQTLDLDVQFDTEGLIGTWSDEYVVDSETLTVLGQSIQSSLIWQVTYTASEGGSIVGESNQIIVDGFSTSPVVAVADEGYEFYRWSDLSTEPERSDTPLNNLNLTAYFIRTETTEHVLNQYR